MSEKKRLKPNVIDFLIVVVVLGAIAGIALRAGVVEQLSDEKNLEKAEISFLILDINDDSGGYFNVGDAFYSPSLAMDLGVLTSVQIMPAEAFITDAEGFLYKTYSNNGRIDVRGTIECAGVFSDTGFLLDGTMYLAPGSTIEIQSTNLDVNLTITDIVPLDSAE